MEKQLNALCSELSEIKCSNKAVLEHLNRFVQWQTAEENWPRKCSCDCAQKIKEISQKYDLLVEESKQKDRVIKDMSIKIDALHHRMNNFGENFSGVLQPPVSLKPLSSHTTPRFDTTGAAKREVAMCNDTVTEPQDDTVRGTEGTDGIETVKTEKTLPKETEFPKNVVKFAETKVNEEEANKREIAPWKTQDIKHKGILKPNLVRKQKYVRADPRNVTVDHQNEKVYIQSKSYFFLMGRIEIENALEDTSNMTRGVHTVFVIDTSASMAEGDKWVQAATFFHDFIDGLEFNAVEHDITQEHVALVLFGHELVVKQRYTNDFDLLRKTFDSLSLGGPSPLYGGVLLGLHTVETVKPIATVGDFEVRTKFILISDGKPTETCLSHGPDKVDPAKDEETKVEIFELMLNTVDFIKIDMFYVSVADGDTAFTETFTEVAEVKRLQHDDGRKLSRRTLIASTRDPLDHLFPLFRGKGNMSKTDREQLDEMTAKNMKVAREMRFKNRYNENTESNLPVVGTRVRRGPDWVHKEEEDGNGPGTIIGHYEEEVSVHWDVSNMIGIYRYGLRNAYDVLIVDEIRKLKPGEKVAVGCRVKPGRNFKVTSNVKLTDRGVIVKCLEDSKKVWVRWDNMKRGEYSYGENGQEEVVVSAQHRHEGGSLLIEYPGPQTVGSDAAGTEKKRNKNKNT